VVLAPRVEIRRPAAAVGAAHVSGRRSRDKGSRGELEVAAIFKAAGFDARRTPNSGGLSWRGDVVGVPGYVLEVKRQETLALPAWLRQAAADAAVCDSVPVVAFRRSQEGWYAALPLEELARLVALDALVASAKAAALAPSYLNATKPAVAGSEGS